MGLELRPYQAETLDALRKGFASGKRAQILYAPTGAGKTEMAIALLEAVRAKGNKAAMILDRDAAPKASECAGLAGVAQGLALVMGDPRHRDPFLPDGMSVAEAVGHAENRLAQAMTLRPGLPNSVLPAFLPVSLTGLYLKKIDAAPDKPLAVSPVKRQLVLWWAARRWG